MKRLLLATDNFLPRWDGVARFVGDMIPLLKKDFDLTVLAPDFGKENIKVRKIKFPTIKFEIGGYPFPVPRYKTILDEVRKADLVFVNGIGPIGSKTLKAAKKLGKPSVLFMHSIEWDLASRAVPLSRAIRKLVYNISAKYSRKRYEKADLVLIPGTEAGWHARQIGIKTKIRLAKVGINTALFKPTENKGSIKKKLGLDPKDFVIGYVGRISRDKDIPTLVKAFWRFNRKHPDSKLVFVGKPIKSYEILLKLNSNIKFFGPQKNVLSYYQAMDAFVLPSLHETTSLVTLEAMSCELPVVVTPMGGIREYLVPGRNGLLFPPRNVRQLLSHLEMLYNNPKLRQMLGREARKTVVKDYDWKKNARKIAKILKDFKSRTK